eukprot:Sspe_Gene.47245::Locus_23934_Transcript_1_1_Confidence_1.000_Length_691::g.47245::m.47245
MPYEHGHRGRPVGIHDNTFQSVHAAYHHPRHELSRRRTQRVSVGRYWEKEAAFAAMETARWLLEQALRWRYYSKWRMFTVVSALMREYHGIVPIAEKLRGERAELKGELHTVQGDLDKAAAENHRLRDEVARLRGELDGQRRGQSDRERRLQGQVEDLQQAMKGREHNLLGEIDNLKRANQ